MNRVLIAALLLISFSSHTGAQTPAVQAEAKRFLVPCKQPEKAAKTNCLAMQKQFVQSYELSTYGQTYFMGDLEGFLDPHGPNAQRVDVTGIRADLIEASAWRYWRWKLAKEDTLQNRYHETWLRTAGELSPDQVEATKARIFTLKELILAQPFPMRADLWRIKEKYAPLEDVASQLEDYAR